MNNAEVKIKVKVKEIGIRNEIERKVGIHMKIGIRKTEDNDRNT